MNDEGDVQQEDRLEDSRPMRCLEGEAVMRGCGCLSVGSPLQGGDPRFRHGKDEANQAERPDWQSCHLHPATQLGGIKRAISGDCVSTLDLMARYRNHHLIELEGNFIDAALRPPDVHDSGVT